MPNTKYRPRKKQAAWLSILLMIILTVLTSCNNSSQSADELAILHYLEEAITDTEICLQDKNFRFPEVIVGPKYNNKGLAQLDALVIAGLLHETEKIVGKPNDGPKYIYHYKQHHLVERKTFSLTDLGINFYRSNQNGGFFCYGQPTGVQIEEVSSFKNKQDKLVLTATFSYIVDVYPDATWISNSWIQQEFPRASRQLKRQKVQQQFIKDGKNSIKPVAAGLVDMRYW